MRLVDLEPQFVRYVDAKRYDYVDSLSEADGVQFLCPLHFERNGGPIGTHSVLYWFVDRVPDGTTPGPGRWIANGSAYDDLTLSPSINLPGEDCGWHGFVRDGTVLNA